MARPVDTMNMNVLEAGPGAATARAAKKKDQVRSAWISFAGRIVAQIIGALATVAFGLLAFGAKHQSVSPAGTAASITGPSGVGPVIGPVRVSGRTMVAVLPLDDYSQGTPDHFVDAMTDAIVTDLSQAGQIHVMSRTSSTQFKSQQVPMSRLATDLGVDFVVAGSVTRVGDRVRITAQLVDARTDAHAWAHTYDRTATNPLALQAEVAGLIAHDVSETLSVAAAAQIADAGPR